MSSKQNNYAFIDGNNLYRSVTDQGWSLDYRRFRQYLKDKHKIAKAYLFIGHINANKNLYTQLQKQGYVLIFRPTLRLPDGRIKGNVDAELVLQAMIDFQKYNQAVIVSGDGDCYCLVKYLDKQGKLLRLIVPDQNKFSSLFRTFMPKIVFLNQLQAKLEYQKKP